MNRTENIMGRACVAAVILLVTFSWSGAAREFSIPGMVAWSLAKSNGFQFMVYGKEDASSEQARFNDPPYDGVQSFLGAAQIISGNGFVYMNRISADLQYEYIAFREKQLAEGWAVKKVELEGEFQWKQEPQTGTRELVFSVFLRGGDKQRASCLIKRIVLEGPEDGRVEDAFVQSP